MNEKKLNNFIEVLQLLKDEVHPDMTVNMMLALFEVAKGKGVTGRDLEDIYGMKHATAARLLRLFDRLQSAGKEGLDLVKVELDPTDYKSKLRLLNDKGEDLFARIDKLI